MVSKSVLRLKNSLSHLGLQNNKKGIICQTKSHVYINWIAIGKLDFTVRYIVTI